MAALTTMANRLEADLVELVGYMGEDPAKMDAETLFQLVVSFGDALHEAVQDIRAIEAKTTSKAPSKTAADVVSLQDRCRYPPLISTTADISIYWMRWVRCGTTRFASWHRHSSSASRGIEYAARLANIPGRE